MAHDVFISYSTKDKTIADAICNNLEKNSIRCWIAPRDVLPGKNWGESIVDAINDAKILVLVLSSNSNQSSMVMRELERAVSTNTTIIPFRVEDVDPSKQLEFFIAGAHWLDALNPPLEEHINSLTQTVSRFLNDEKSTDNHYKPIESVKNDENEPNNSLIHKKLQKLILSKISPRKLAISVGAIVIILILVFNFVSPIMASHTYEDALVKFNYPSNWEQEPDPNSPCFAAVRDPYSIDLGDYGIGVTVSKVATSKPLSLTKDLTLAQFSNTTKGFQIISDNNTEFVGGISGYRTDFQYYNQYHNQELLIKDRLIFVQKDSYCYMISCIAPSNEFDNQTDNFRMVIDSFTFK